jgi:hypothetical protein
MTQSINADTSRPADPVCDVMVCAAIKFAKPIVVRRGQCPELGFERPRQTGSFGAAGLLIVESGE